ncbi:MAG: carbamoyltransferase HypF [Thermodesulfovibrio sp.]|nr:carbamoyltransferase HypF [Thermodesulfovibrio sp.]
MRRFHILVKGIVQGVGFRPFVYNLAKSFNFRGYVTNTSHGVVIEIEGENPDEFIKSLHDKCPSLAKIDSIDVRELPANGYKDFTIIHSIDEGSFTHVSPDNTVCSDCLNELFDPSDRRYLYPFINCTNCGPRYTITKKVPYDRPNTTMSVFTMCPLCMDEYNDPSNRRFHAQPNACPVCGPGLEFRVQSSEFRVKEKQNPLDAAIDFIKQGAIIAVKGLGGFHICCDAENRESVENLRERKQRRNKPFAIMSPDVETIRQFCEISEKEAEVLEDRRRPIVLLKKKIGLTLPDAIAPKNKYLGFMLPYTPLHYLLFHVDKEHKAAGRYHFSALVMTSGNLSEEPIVVDNDDALSRLSGIADAFLFHNRDIFMRVDDSVVKIHNSKTIFVRRSRGYVPEAISLKEEGHDVLGCGAEIKNTFAITKGDSAIVSQHIGDMENYETLQFFEESLNNMKQVYRANPAAVAYDLHPNYLSTQWALRHSKESDVKSYGIQHHYAHIASVMAENGLNNKVIGVAFDGTGYGTDGNLWGSEFLICDIDGFERAARFKYIPLPGGEMAIKECWRTAISYVADSLHTAHNPKLIWDSLDLIGFVGKYGRGRIENILKLIENRQFSPLSSGAGRLFDAVSAIAGICDVNTYEGEAAIALESMLYDGRGFEKADAYPFEILEGEPIIVDFSTAILQLIEDIKRKENSSLISHRFHNTIISIINKVISVIKNRYGINEVALSGGVFQNAYILEGTQNQLESSGLRVYINENVPCNDACISLGQAYILRERLKKS